jgi:hypothetical protein
LQFRDNAKNPGRDFNVHDPAITTGRTAQTDIQIGASGEFAGFSDWKKL